MSEKFRKVVVGVLSLALVLTMVGATGCTTDGDTGSDGDDGGDAMMGGTFKFYISEPAFIDPVNLQESEGTQVGQSLFDSLVTFDPLTSEIAPAAAESWEANEDASVWTFNLADATFHNGDPVTAADFKYAWERICNPDNESEISYHLAPVMGFDDMQAGDATELEGVVAVDDTTLEVTLSYPFADFEYVVGHPALAPVPMDAVENGVEYDGEMVDFGEMPIGNGPFMMMEPWAHDQYIKVEANADYYGDVANIDGVDFMILADQDTAFLEFQAGNLDFVPIPTGQIESTKAEYGESVDGYSVDPGSQTVLGAQLATYYLLMNNEDEVLSDATVRAALSSAINRDQIVEKVFEGTRIPATGIVPPGMVGFQEDAWKYAPYDPDMAASLLEEAGYPGGEGLPVINLEYNTGSGHEDILALVASDLEALGIETELVGTEWAQYLDKLEEKTYQVGRLGWLADYPVMDNFLYPLFLTGSHDNYSFYSNPEVDSLLEEARTTTDGDKRVEMYQEAERLMGEDAPVIPIVFYRHTRVASDRVNDGVFSPNGLFNFESCYLADAE